MNHNSESSTRWAVFCPDHGRVYLSREEYDRQIDLGNSRWKCPRFSAEKSDRWTTAGEHFEKWDVGPCGAVSEWDDDTYEASEEEAKP